MCVNKHSGNRAVSRVIQNFSAQLLVTCLMNCYFYYCCQIFSICVNYDRFHCVREWRWNVRSLRSAYTPRGDIPGCIIDWTITITFTHFTLSTFMYWFSAFAFRTRVWWSHLSFNTPLVNMKFSHTVESARTKVRLWNIRANKWIKSDWISRCITCGKCVNLLGCNENWTEVNWIAKSVENDCFPAFLSTVHLTLTVKRNAHTTVRTNARALYAPCNWHSTDPCIVYSVHQLHVKMEWKSKWATAKRKHTSERS